MPTVNFNLLGLSRYVKLSLMCFLGALMVICMADNVIAQCLPTEMQNLSAGLSRPKVGAECTDTSCPIWYLKSTTGITSISSTQVDPYSSSDTLIWNDGGAVVTVDPYTLSNGQADFYGCTSYSPWTTNTYNSGSGTYWYVVADYNATYTKNITNGTWDFTWTETGGYSGSGTGVSIDSTIDACFSEADNLPGPVYGWGNWDFPYCFTVT